MYQNADAGDAQAALCQDMQEEEDDKDACYVCADGGKLLICELCEQVAHPKCVGLKRAPKVHPGP